MGISYSKVNRKVPKSLPKSVQPSRTPDNTLNHLNLQKDSLAASKESKDHYDKDIDPSFLANLRQLGQVKVETPTTVRKTGERILNMYEARKISEQQAASPSPVPNCLSASSLASLLDDRKFMNSHTEVKKLAARYNFDYSLLENLASFVTTPSVGQGTVVRTKSPETDEERLTMRAVWSEPALKK